VTVGARARIVNAQPCGWFDGLEREPSKLKQAAAITSLRVTHIK
jgi:hypothetical protein